MLPQSPWTLRIGIGIENGMPNGPQMTFQATPAVSEHGPEDICAVRSPAVAAKVPARPSADMPPNALRRMISGTITELFAGSTGIVSINGVNDQVSSVGKLSFRSLAWIRPWLVIVRSICW